ncbi:MAG: choice-of-anchor M domain-containing protein [Limisphaerales bacterium]
MKPQYLPRAAVSGLALVLAAALPAAALTPIYSGHTDIAIGYNPTLNLWDPHVHDEENDMEYEPDDALIVIGLDALTTVPAGPQWSFLGSPGSATWILTSTEVPTLPYLGLSTEGISPGTFTGDTLSFRLKAISGPGHFALFDLDSFGDPIVLMNSGDGITLADTAILPIGSHLHYHWAFSEAGDYTLTFEAFGNSALHGLTSSGDVDFLFRVDPIPEPSTFALVTLGLAALALQRRKSRT